jgi:hypothetical protein
MRRADAAAPPATIRVRFNGHFLAVLYAGEARSEMASDAFNRGEFAPKRDSEYAEKGGNPADETFEAAPFSWSVEGLGLRGFCGSGLLGGFVGHG